MVIKLSRLFILILVILVGSATLPYYYKISFGKRVVTPMVSYSPITEDFLVSNVVNNNFFYMDKSGHEYSRSEADELLPLQNYRLLLAKNQMPDSVQGVKIDVDSLRKNNLFFRVRPRDIDMPGIDMFPLFESRPARLKLYMPQEYFTINSKFVFTDAASNRNVDSLSSMFTRALRRAGFTFPGRKFFGNPTTRKAFDEGYFVVDDAGKMFQIKKIHGRPFCRQIPLPKNLRVRHMVVYENGLREFYGAVISESNDVYLVLYDHYKLKKLNIGDYNALEDELLFRGNILNRQVSVIKSDRVLATVFDRNYQIIANHEVPIGKHYSKFAEQAYQLIFPFELNISRPQSYYVGFHFSTYSLIALYLNTLLMLSLLFWKRYHSGKGLRKWYDFVLVLVAGIFGFIAILIYENTDL